MELEAVTDRSCWGICLNLHLKGSGFHARILAIDPSHRTWMSFRSRPSLRIPSRWCHSHSLSTIPPPCRNDTEPVKIHVDVCCSFPLVQFPTNKATNRYHAEALLLVNDCILRTLRRNMDAVLPHYYRIEFHQQSHSHSSPGIWPKIVATRLQTNRHRQQASVLWRSRLIVYSDIRHWGGGGAAMSVQSPVNEPGS